MHEVTEETIRRGRSNVFTKLEISEKKGECLGFEGLETRPSIEDTRVNSRPKVSRPGLDFDLELKHMLKEVTTRVL